MQYFISDTHFDHTNIIKYCNRPFASTDEMNAHILNQWNSTVNDDDTVFFLGDLTYGRGRRTHAFWLHQLKGQLRFVRGSHARRRDLNGIEYFDRLTIDILGKPVLLIHDSASAWDWSKSHWMIHGHHHNNYPEKHPLVSQADKRINVSAELINYMPISLKAIEKLIIGL